MKCTGSILFFIAVMTGTALLGQNFRYRVYEGERTPFVRVNQTLEDHKGFVWVASDSGLYRFDGQKFRDFNLSLKSRHIQCLVSKGRDTILFSNDSGIFKLYYIEEEVVVDPFAAIGEGTDIGYIHHMFIDSREQLWASSLNGKLVTFGPGGTRTGSFSLPGEPANGDTYLGEDANQTLWALAPGKGLFRYEESTGAFSQQPGFDDARHFYVGEDQLYLVGDGIQRLSVASGNVLRIPGDIPAAGQPFDYITRDLAGTYFITSGDALFTLDEGQNLLHKVFGSNDPHRVEELPFRGINSMGFSSDQIRGGGKIWISAKNGLGLLHTGYFSGLEGMPHDNVFSIAAGAGPEVLVSQGNVVRVDLGQGDKTFQNVSGPGRVTGISLVGNNRYFGTADGEIIMVERGKPQRIRDLGQRGGGIFFMSADSRGDVWFCQAPTDKPLRGVGKLRPNGEFRFYGPEQGLDSRILVIREGGRSEIYAAGIGTGSYLFKYLEEADVFEDRSLPLPPDVSTNFEVHDLSIDSLGIVWLGTTDGLFKYDTETVGRVDLGPFTTNEIRAVQTLGNGGVWIATDTDGLIYRYPSGEYVLFDEASGTPSKIASYRCLALDEQGTLWAGTAEGVVYSSLTQPEPLMTHSPAITEVRINNRPVGSSDITISEKAEVRVGLATISYPAKGVRYQHKLVDRSLSEEASGFVPWSPPSENTSAHLQDLASGQYTFLVRAQLPGGYGWSEPVAVQMHVRKAWYATWWGLSLLLATGLAGLWFVTYRSGRSKTQNLTTALTQKQQDLEDKEAQLTVKSDALANREEELKATGANLYMLNRLLEQLPRSGPWEEVLPVLKKLVLLPTGLDAFEVGLLVKNEIVQRGYRRKGGQYTERREEFNDKENIQSYALGGLNPILLNDYEAEVGEYIGRKPPKQYASILVVPFKQSNGSDAVFSAYARDKGRFSQRDLALIKVLVNFLSITVTPDPN